MLHLALSKLVLVTGGLMLVVAGVSLILVSSSLYRKLQTVLERPWRIERLIYRHHRSVGGIIVVGVLVILVFLGKHQAQIVESSAWHAVRGLQLAWLAAWGLAAFAMVIGVFIFIRPSVLKNFESMANRWVDPFPTVLSGKISLRRKLAGLFQSNPKPAGVLLLLVGMACLLIAAKLAVA